MRNGGQRGIFQSDGERYRGRKLDIVLPALLWIGHRMASSITVRYGIGVYFLDELRRHPLVDEPIQEIIPAFRDLQPGTKVEGDARGARLHIGRSLSPT
jgi:hypothetical protein